MRAIWDGAQARERQDAFEANPSLFEFERVKERATSIGLTSYVKRMARRYLNDKSNRPVEYDPSHIGAPEWRGESWHYETKGGRRIYHPSAYSRRGWSNMVYVHSTIRIVVGPQFIVDNSQES